MEGDFFRIETPRRKKTEFDENEIYKRIMKKVLEAQTEQRQKLEQACETQIKEDAFEPDERDPDLEKKAEWLNDLVDKELKELGGGDSTHAEDIPESLNVLIDNGLKKLGEGDSTQAEDVPESLDTLFNEALESLDKLDSNPSDRVTESLKGEKSDFKKERGYWKQWENVEKELRSIIAEKFDGNFPSTKKLYEAGYGGLVYAIYEYHGGINEVRKRLYFGIERQSPGYWMKWENVERELQRIITDEFGGNFPNEEKLREAGYSGLDDAIKNYYGGINEVRRHLGYEIERQSPGYWVKWENVERELQQIIVDEFDGNFPSEEKLREAGYSSLVDAIKNYHGGINVVRKRLGHRIERQSPRYWEKWENVEGELQRIIAGEFDGNFPSEEELYKAGYNGLVSAIYRYHRGLIEVRKRLGHGIERQSPGYWMKWENVEETLQRIIINEFSGKFPTTEKLYEAGYGGIVKAICEYHGGIDEVRKRLGYPDWINDRGDKSSYYIRRGLATEHLVKNILKEWADLNKFPYSKKSQTAIGGHHYLEFVCNTKKVYGVDITNARYALTVESKWENKEYHKYVDELWVIVVSDKIGKWSRDSKEFREIFKQWNRNSPENVLVIDYRHLEEFLNGLSNHNIPFEIPIEKIHKLEILANCTFENKEELKSKLKKGKRFDPQRTLQEFQD